MSYLRGPLTRTQIKSLSGRALTGSGSGSNLQTGNLQTSSQTVTGGPSGFLSNVSAAVPKGGSVSAATNPAPPVPPVQAPPVMSPSPSSSSSSSFSSASNMAPVMAPGLSQFFIPAKAASFDPQKGEVVSFSFC